MMTKSIEADILRQYARMLFPEEGGGYSAMIFEFPACLAQGETAQEAIDNLEKAAQSWITETLDLGLAIPAPISFLLVGKE